MSDEPKVPAIETISEEPTAEEIRKNFQPYAAELGSLVYAWNQLHDALGTLFWSITGIKNGAIPLAIWHATRSDRTQRDMLRAATEARFKAFLFRPKKLDKEQEKRERDEIIWLLEEINELANRRNDAIHSPYWFFITPGRMRLVANDFQGNPRAKNLKDKDLLEEFKLYRDAASALSLYAKRLNMSLGNAKIPWPDRPQSPGFRRKKNLQRPRRQSPAK